MNDNYKCVVVADDDYVMLDGKKGYVTLGGLLPVRESLTIKGLGYLLDNFPPSMQRVTTKIFELIVHTNMAPGEV